MEEIRDLLARLAELTAAECTAAIERVRAVATELSEGEVDGDTADQLEELAGALDQFQARGQELEAEETARQERAAAALARINGDGGDGSGAETPAEGENEGGEGEGANGEQVPAAATASSGTPAAPPRLPTPGTMGASGRGNAAQVTPQGAGTGSTAVRPLVAQAAIVAAADLGGGVATGQEFGSLTALAEAFDRRRRAVAQSRSGRGENVVVASIVANYPEARVLGDDATINSQRIREATERTALVAGGAIAQQRGAVVAAGGLCAPVDTLYDVPMLGSTARPVRDALAGFQTTRGGVTYRKPPVFQDSEGAVSVWTLAMDEAQHDPDADDPTPKPCLDVWCPDMDTAYIEAIPFCQTFSNITSRFDPESTAANIRAGLIAHARYAENRLLAGIANASKTLTSASTVSAAQDLLVMADHVIAYFRNRHRLEDEVPLRMILPRWGRDLIRAGITRGLAAAYDLEAFAVANATIDAWFTRRGVNITWHIDGRAGTSAGAGEVAMADQFYGNAADLGAVPGFPDQVEALIFQEGDWLFLDGGTLDLGVVRDSTLNSTNQYRQFMETFEGLAGRGVEPLRVVAGAQPTGAHVGTIAPALAD